MGYVIKLYTGNRLYGRFDDRDEAVQCLEERGWEYKEEQWVLGDYRAIIEYVEDEAHLPKL